MSGYHWEGDTLVLRLRVQPRAARDEFVGPLGDTLKVRVTAPPVEGQANAHLIRWLAELFEVPRAQITLAGGATGRLKTLRIQAPRTLPPPLSRS